MQESLGNNLIFIVSNTKNPYGVFSGDLLGVNFGFFILTKPGLGGGDSLFLAVTGSNSGFKG